MKPPISKLFETDSEYQQLHRNSELKNGKDIVVMDSPYMCLIELVNSTCTIPQCNKDSMRVSLNFIQWYVQDI